MDDMPSPRRLNVGNRKCERFFVTDASDDFAELIGEDLSGVTFVRDYLQLQFNPPPILKPIRLIALAGVVESQPSLLLKRAVLRRSPRRAKLSLTSGGA
jgi:hypothetical protein